MIHYLGGNKGLEKNVIGVSLTMGWWAGLEALCGRMGRKEAKFLHAAWMDGWVLAFHDLHELK